MDDNNLQDLFNLGSDDNKNAADNSSNNSASNPNVAPLDDFFNNVAPLSSNSNQANINEPVSAPTPEPAPEPEPMPQAPVQDPILDTFQSVETNINQGVDQVDQSFSAFNENVQEQAEQVHSTIDTNPMHTTLSENSSNPNLFNNSPAEPDPMLEHMAGDDLNNAFSSNPGNVSAPNPSDVYRNSAAMNYANNAQSQVNFNQQAQANAYSTKKKTNPFLVILLILLIVAVLVVLGYFVYTTILTKKGNDDNSGENQNTVAPVIDNLPDTYQYLTDIDSLSQKSLDKLADQDEFALINSTHGLLTQSRLPLSLHFDVDGEYFILDVNKNEDMFFTDIRVPKIQGETPDPVVFYYINPELEFIKGSIVITDLTAYDLVKTNEDYQEKTISLWDLFYSENDLQCFYKLGDNGRYYLNVVIEDSNIATIEEEELDELLENIVTDLSVSTDSTPTDTSPYTYLDGYVELDKKEYESLKLDDNYSLDLINSLYITGWTINKKDNANVISALTKDDSYNIQIVELAEPVEDINNVASELTTDYNASQTLIAQYSDVSGFTLNVPVIADENGNLLGIAVEANETCYLFLIAGSSIEDGAYATTYITQEAFLDQMTYLFNNVIKYTPGEEDEDATTVEDRDEDEEDDVEEEVEEEEEESDEEVEEDEEEETNTNSSTRTERRTTRNTSTNEDEE